MEWLNHILALIPIHQILVQYQRNTNIKIKNILLLNITNSYYYYNLKPMLMEEQTMLILKKR